MTEKSQAHEQQCFVNYFDLIEVFVKATRPYNLSSTAKDVLLTFITKIKNHTGNIVNIREKRWDGRPIYCQALLVQDVEIITRAFRELRKKGVMMSEENTGKNSTRFLTEGFLDQVKSLINGMEKNRLTTCTDAGSQKTTYTAAGTTPYTAVGGVPTPLPGVSNIEELTKVTDKFKLARKTRASQAEPTDRVRFKAVGLAKGFESLFEKTKKSPTLFAENNDWFEDKLRGLGEPALKRFVEYVKSKMYPGKTYRYSPESRDRLFGDFAQVDAFDPSNDETDWNGIMASYREENPSEGELESFRECD